MPAPKRVCNQSACQHKGKPQTITNFYRDMRDKKHGRANECKDCIKKRNKQPVFLNPMTDEQMRQWNIDNPVVRTTASTVEERIING